jgi:hypothetical protein
MKNKVHKILILKLRKGDDILPPQMLFETLKNTFPSIEVDFATYPEYVNLLPQARKLRIYDKTPKESNFFKRLFNELKFLFFIKKEKYKAAIVTSPSDKGIILAKYAKIKQIVGFRSNDKKIDAAVTHKISLDENIKIENIIEVLSLLKL